MWEELSPVSNQGKLYLELATILGRYMNPYVWANTWNMSALSHTQHYLQAYIALTEDIINALRHDNPPFNEARFRKEMLQVSRHYAKLAQDSPT